MPYHKHYVIRSLPLVRSKGCSPRTNDPTRQPAVTDRQQKKEGKKSGTLVVQAQVLSGMFYGVVANRRQPDLYKIGGRGVTLRAGVVLAEEVARAFFFL